MTPTYICKVCGERVSSLVRHIADAHAEYLLAPDVAETFGIGYTTVLSAKRLAGVRSVPLKPCPRCGEGYTGKVAHLLECHLGILMCARHTLGLEHKDVARMFFNGGVTDHDISDVFQIVKHQDDATDIDVDDLPKTGIPICSDGNGGIRVMGMEETGVGHIFVDEVLSWQLL